jgi:DNA-binding NarL/FixJ family response regulator
VLSLRVAIGEWAPAVLWRHVEMSLGNAEQLLTSREMQVADLVGQGHSNRLVAEILNLAEGTVKVHLHAIFKKLGVRSRMALIVKLSNRQARPTERATIYPQLG